VWGYAQRDRQEILRDAWTAMWQDFLKALKRHGWSWNPASMTVEEGSEANGWIPKRENVPAPVLDAGLEAALGTAYGVPFKAACSLLMGEHPYFGQVETSEPGLRAELVEKRVRDVWMREGRP
jgi:hypothetical protein